MDVAADLSVGFAVDFVHGFSVDSSVDLSVGFSVDFALHLSVDLSAGFPVGFPSGFRNSFLNRFRCGFRCGFLGLLHMEIVQERLEREGGAEIIQTAPTVNYRIELTDDTTIDIHNPADLPDPTLIKHICEPIVRVEIICPDENIGDLMRLCETRRGIFKGQKFVSAGRQMLDYELPLAEIIYDFYDKLKSITRGYGTMDYEIIEFRADKLVKVGILVNGDPVEALSMICHRDKAVARTRIILLKLRKQIDRHQFEIAHVCANLRH